MTLSPINKQGLILEWNIPLDTTFLVKYFQKDLGLGRIPYRVFFNISNLQFPRLLYCSNNFGISTNNFSFYSSFAWINADVISPCFDFNCKNISRMSINQMVVHWTMGAWVSKKCIPLSCASPRAHNLALNFFLSPSGYLFNLKYHVYMITLMQSSRSTTSQVPTPSKISSSVHADWWY